MLDEKDLQAIAQLMSAMETRINEKMSSMETRMDEKMSSMEARMDEKMSAMEARIDEKMAEQEHRIMNNMKILLDTEVTTRFNLLAEDISIIRETMATKEDLEEIHDTLEVHAALLKQHSRDIRTLKKAN